jgi:hypothetical protein
MESNSRAKVKGVAGSVRTGAEVGGQTGFHFGAFPIPQKSVIKQARRDSLIEVLGIGWIKTAGLVGKGDSQIPRWRNGGGGIRGRRGAP